MIQHFTTWKGAFAIALFALVNTAFAQKAPADKTKDKDQEIVIIKKGGQKEKFTFTIDGDEVIVNGKPVDEFVNKDVTVIIRDVDSDAIRKRVMVRGLHPAMPGTPAAPKAPAAPHMYYDNGGANANRAFLGVVTEKADEGAKIREVSDDSPAEEAGLLPNDVIVKIDNHNIDGPQKLSETIRAYKPEDKVEVTYKRDGKQKKMKVTLGKNKATTFSFDIDDRNFTIPDIPRLENFNFNFTRRPKLGVQIQDLQEGAGVKVTEIEEDSPADKAGLDEGDIITQYNGTDVKGVDDMREKVKDIKEGDTLNLTFKRNGTTKTTEVKVPKKVKTIDL